MLETKQLINVENSYSKLKIHTYLIHSQMSWVKTTPILLEKKVPEILI